MLIYRQCNIVVVSYYMVLDLTSTHIFQDAFVCSLVLQMSSLSRFGRWIFSNIILHFYELQCTYINHDTNVYIIVFFHCSYYYFCTREKCLYSNVCVGYSNYRNKLFTNYSLQSAQLIRFLSPKSAISYYVFIFFFRELQWPHNGLISVRLNKHELFSETDFE